MPIARGELSTGLPDLDRVIRGLLPGDNVVWQVDDPAHYRQFAIPFCKAAVSQGRETIYFRFASHDPLVEPTNGVQVLALNPRSGFETFASQVRGTIQRMGTGAYYIFDCLSELAEVWLSDEMLGSFFLLTCPYLLDMETVAYFGLLRNRHAPEATALIRQTTQIFLDVIPFGGEEYLYPIKVQQRYSPTMHNLHLLHGDRCTPVVDSDIIARIQQAAPWMNLGPMGGGLGLWHRGFRQAEEVLEYGEAVLEPRRETEGGTAPARPRSRDLKNRLLRMAVSRDERMLELLDRYLTLEDLVAIRRRMIGTGLIGGKAVGMLLARAILKTSDPRWETILEPHDSFYVGSDVFYTYLVNNGVWWVREKQRNPEGFLEGSETARQHLLTGTFPDYAEKQFLQMLDYFGQWPIIVRSSSLLEDNFGNAFAGKYESEFCVNQGPGQQRIGDFHSAVRAIYASAMSEKALVYRSQRGLLERDEQMALLIQRVSGKLRDGLFLPDLAGVGLSLNPYVWHREIDPAAGVLRIVMGLGTRAVDRTDDDYSRVVALNAPRRRLESTFDQIRRYSQRRVDCLDLEANRLISVAPGELARRAPDLPMPMLASYDRDLEERAGRSTSVSPWVLTFEGLLDRTEFAEDMRRMLGALQEAYQYPVDVEFTTNLKPDGSYRVNLVQCRPLQVRGAGPDTSMPQEIPAGSLLLASAGPIIGQSTDLNLERIVFIRPDAYARLPLNERHQVARLVGSLAGVGTNPEGRAMLLAGPGRWGTSTPSLGVPVTFADISGATVVCEVAAMGEHAPPDVSLGTHFLNELIEADMLYLAVYPNRSTHVLNETLIESLPNRLGRLLPDAVRWAEVIHVLEAADLPAGTRVRFTANTPDQRAVCYLTGDPTGPDC